MNESRILRPGVQLLAPAGASPDAVNGRLLSSAGWMAASHLTAQAFAYGSLLFLARMLSPASFGIVVIGTTVVYAAALLVDHGSHGGIVLRPQLSRRYLVGVLVRCLLISGVLACLMAAFAGPLVELFASGGDATAFAALSLCLPLYAVALVPTALLERSMEFGRLAALTAMANVVSATAAVVAGLAGLGVWSLVVRLLGMFLMLAVLTTLFCRSSLQNSLAVSRPQGDRSARQAGGPWFFLFGVAFMLTMNLDYLVIGNSTDAHLVGLYALAFTIAMSPCTQFSEQVGRVLLAAAAAAPETSREQAERSVALMSLLLLPLLPAGIVLAPVVLPALLGAQWTPIVPVFQVLFIAAIPMAIVNCLGEALAGAGYMAFRAKVMVFRCAATLLALFVLVRIGGITGAAFAHLAVFAPCAVLYCTVGARLIGTSAGALWQRVRPAVAVVFLQLAVTSAAVLMLRECGASEMLTATIAAVVGLAAAVTWALRSTVRHQAAAPQAASLPGLGQGDTDA
jgi:O-antigen/teichoic acid export membrane protein